MKPSSNVLLIVRHSLLSRPTFSHSPTSLFSSPLSLPSPSPLPSPLLSLPANRMWADLMFRLMKGGLEDLNVAIYTFLCQNNQEKETWMKHFVSILSFLFFSLLWLLQGKSERGRKGEMKEREGGGRRGGGKKWKVDLWLKKVLKKIQATPRSY